MKWVMWIPKNFIDDSTPLMVDSMITGKKWRRRLKLTISYLTKLSRLYLHSYCLKNPILVHHVFFFQLWLTCQWKGSSPTGPAEHWAGGSLLMSFNSLFILLRAIFPVHYIGLSLNLQRNASQKVWFWNKVKLMNWGHGGQKVHTKSHSRRSKPPLKIKRKFFTKICKIHVFWSDYEMV